MIIKTKKAFTLVELLIAIAIIGILSSIVMVNLNASRTKARDAKRITEISAIQMQLELYYSKYGRYPDSDTIAPTLDATPGSGGWDIGNADHPFMMKLASFLGYDLPRDMTKNGDLSGYFYYRYSSADSTAYGCGGKPFYVIATTLEGTYNSSEKSNISPGWKCTGRDWQNEFGWVTGKFE